MKFKTFIKLLSIVIFLLVLSFSFSNKPVNAIGASPAAADFIIGQSDFSNGVPNKGTLTEGIYYPYGVSSDATHVYVVDSYNSRVLVYNGHPGETGWDNIADYVIGQPNMTSNTANNGGVSASTLYVPISVFSDGSRIYVGDYYNNRVLVYNGIPGQTGWNNVADYVIGQPNMTSNTANNGGLSASTLYYPRFAYSDGSKVYISDSNNNRVLVYSGIPGEAGWDNIADYVIGQPNMTSGTANNGGRSATSLSLPSSVMTDSSHVYVSDINNHRVLVYNDFPGQSGWDNTADYVIGQPNMTSGTANNGGIGASTLYNPQYTFADSSHVFIADYNNNRALVYNGIPGQAGWDNVADSVIGQPDMVTNTANNGGVSASSLYQPRTFYSDSNHIYIVETNNNRVLIYNSTPGQAGWDAVADYVIGQPNMTNNIMDAGQITASSLFNPFSIYRGSTHTYIADTSNNRVLVYNGHPEEAGWDNIADYVIGQPNMTSGTANNGGISASSLYAPRSVFEDGSHVYVAEYNNCRVLIYNGVPGEPGWDNVADYVIGQPNMNSNTSNNGGRSATSISYAYAVYADDSRVYVTDWGNNRILVYNGIPGQAGWDNVADYVIGQPDMISGTANNGGLSASSLNQPESLAITSTHTYVADTYNNRVVVYNGKPGEPGWDAVADYVIGQPNMTSNAANNGGISASSLNQPCSVFNDNQNLFINDSNNHRISIFNGIPGQAGWDNVADYVIGQPDMTTGTANNGGTSAISLYYPTSIYVDNNLVYTTELSNNRALIFKLGPQNVSATSSISSSTNATIQLSAVNAKDVMMSEDSGFSGAVWQTYATSIPLTLSNGDGIKTVYVKMRDYANYESTAITTNVTLDTVAPTGSIQINNGAAYTNLSTVTLTLNANDSGTAVSQMMVSSTSNFVGASWEPFVTSKSFVLSSVDGLKTVYIKYKDAANNESAPISDTITLDTIKPKVTISDIGFITSVPDKTPLTYYFTSQTPRIKGNTDSNSEVFFNYGSTTYKAKADSEGHYDITLSEPKLPRSRVTLKYYAVDEAGNRSSERLLTLIIGIENFPVSENVVEVSVSPTVTPTNVPDTPIMPNLVQYQIIDSSGNLLTNTDIVIDGQIYRTDAKGLVYLEGKILKETVEVKYQTYQVSGHIKGSVITLDKPTVTNKPKEFNYWWLMLLILGLLAIVITKKFTRTKANKKN